MQNFFDTLICESKHEKLPEAFNYFGKLIGSWSIDYVDSITSQVIKGEWHFSWVLEGMAVQDVIVLPGFEYGTTLRVYNPDTHAWDIAYCYTGKIMRFEARKQDDIIVLTNIEDERRKWVLPKLRTIIFIGRMLGYKITVNGLFILTCMPSALNKHFGRYRVLDLV